jgi:hypothetical protein
VPKVCFKIKFNFIFYKGYSLIFLRIILKILLLFYFMLVKSLAQVHVHTCITRCTKTLQSFVSETCTLCTLFILFFPIPSDALIRPSNSNQPIEVAQLLVLSARLHRRTVVRPRIVKDNSTAKSQASPLKPTRIVSFQLNHTRANARGGVRAAHV